MRHAYLDGWQILSVQHVLSRFWIELREHVYVMCHVPAKICTASLQRAIYPNTYLYTQIKLQPTQHVELCILQQP